MIKPFLMIAAVSGFLAVALGAFGAHGLQGKITERLLAAYKTGVEYQFYHTLALLAVVWLMQWRYSVLWAWGGYLFIAGILLFSGSLYLMAFGGPKWLGPSTPLGGVCFMAGWLCLLAGAIKS